jgi:hypothetical protein
MVLLASNFPPVALIGFSGFRLAYASLYPEEMFRRMSEGDGTYAFADLAFMMSLVFGGAWIVLTHNGYVRGIEARDALREQD